MPKPTIPQAFSFSARVSSQGEGWTDIEMRSTTEKYTIATVEDRFASLFLATPALLDALQYIAPLLQNVNAWNIGPAKLGIAMSKAEAAIALATGKDGAA